ncbi:hypothetical protein [Kocuria sp. CPCC 205261]|uniref:hypothetical protein n=1 Tax=Kocuria sp. CPCC 205261 TaxID=3073554 RepID=UPI0034D76EF3
MAADRAGISSAPIVDGHTYLVDCGRACVTQSHKAGLSFASLRGIFLTHLHADPVADYFNYFMMASTTGRKNGDVIPGQLAVYGPGPAGGLPEPFGGRPVGIVSPEEPTPGTTSMTAHLLRVFAYTNNIFMRGEDVRDYDSLVAVNEIMPPHSAHVMVEDMGPVVQASHVDHLVLSHIENTGGTIDPVEWHRLASRGYDGAVTVGQDLQIITVA